MSSEMKFDGILSTLSIALAGLLGYFIYFITKDGSQDILCGLGASLCFALTIVPL